MLKEQFGREELWGLSVVGGNENELLMRVNGKISTISVDTKKKSKANIKHIESG